MVQKYGTIIKEERLRNDMQRDVLANILLLSDEEMEKVESGQKELSDYRLNICANIFGLSKEVLIAGVRRPAISNDEILRQFQELKEQIDRLTKKEHVEEEIAQEAASFGMTVEEYAASDYEAKMGM